MPTCRSICRVCRVPGIVLPLLAFALAVFAPGGAAAQTPAPTPAVAPAAGGAQVVLTEQAVLDYAEALFQEGQYFRAISEFHRLQHYFPDSPHLAGARLRIAEATVNGGQPEDAAAMLTDWLEEPQMAAWRGEMLYLRALARLESNVRAPYSQREVSIAAALEDLRALPPGWSGAARARDFADAVERQQDLAYRPPWLAGLMSVLLPGAGSVYADSPGIGSLAFGANAVLIAGAAQSLRLGQDALAGVLGAAALAAYALTIREAYRSANAFNDLQRSVHLERQRTRHGLELRTEGLRGVFNARD